MRNTGLFKSVYSLHVEGLPTYIRGGEERWGGVTGEEGEEQNISESQCTYMATCTYRQCAHNNICMMYDCTYVRGPLLGEVCNV